MRVDSKTSSDEPRPVADLSTLPEAIHGDWTHEELFRLCMVEYPRRLHAATPTERKLILSRRPPPTGTIWDTAIAASMEHAALVHNLRPPEWTDEETRFHDEPVELLPQTASTVLCHLPAPFTRRGIIMDPRNLDRKGGNEQWSPEAGDPDERWPRNDSLDADNARIRKILYIQKPATRPERGRSTLYNACACIERMAARQGWVFRITVDTTNTPSAFVMRGSNTPGGEIRALEREAAQGLIREALRNINLHERDWHQLLKTASEEIETRRIPPRTLWNRPALTVAGVADGIRRRWQEAKQTRSEPS